MEEENNLLKLAEREMLGLPDLKVKTDKKYHNIKVDLYSENVETREMLFMMLDDIDDIYNSVLSLAGIKKGNDKILNLKAPSTYVILTDRKDYFEKEWSSSLEKNNILLVDGTNDLNKILSMYSAAQRVLTPYTEIYHGSNGDISITWE